PKWSGLIGFRRGIISRPTTAPHPSTSPLVSRSASALPRREPAAQPRAAHDGGDPDPPTRNHRPPLLRTQTARGQDTERGDALLEAGAVRCRVIGGRRRARAAQPP